MKTELSYTNRNVSSSTKVEEKINVIRFQSRSERKRFDTRRVLSCFAYLSGDKQNSSLLLPVARHCRRDFAVCWSRQIAQIFDNKPLHKH